MKVHVDVLYIDQSATFQQTRQPYAFWNAPDRRLIYPGHDP